jgi:predicted transcriptional regulator
MAPKARLARSRRGGRRVPQAASGAKLPAATLDRPNLVRLKSAERLLARPRRVLSEPRARAAERAVAGVRGPAIQQAVADGALWQQAQLDGDRRGTSFLDLGEVVLDTPRLQVSGDRHRWNESPVPTANVDTGLRITDFSALTGRLLLGRASKGEQAPTGGPPHHQLPAARNCSTTSLLMRPRGETSMPCPLAQARTAAGSIEPVVV